MEGRKQGKKAGRQDSQGPHGLSALPPTPAPGWEELSAKEPLPLCLIPPHPDPRLPSPSASLFLPPGHGRRLLMETQRGLK